ncbi:MAG: rRNA maturation RNase YbeY [Bacteroidales bacterium]|nr:rRNA maturation RNase YbeY [Bacteroidales bacterium]
MIEYTNEGVDLPSLDFNKITSWIDEVAKTHLRLLGPITYIFCSDEEILRVNREFLQHDYYTDIITFDDSRGRLIRGDIFISLPTVGYNAKKIGEEYSRELHRVIIHGILHLCGINDKGPGEREIMEQHENESLALIGL